MQPHIKDKCALCYLFGGGLWALVSRVVSRCSQVYLLGRDPSSLPCCCCLCCLDNLYTFGGNGFLFVFELLPGLAVVR